MRSLIILFAVLASTSTSFARGGVIPTEDQLRDKIQRDLSTMTCVETADLFQKETTPRVVKLLNGSDKRNQIEKNLSAVVVEEVSARLVSCLRGEE